VSGSAAAYTLTGGDHLTGGSCESSRLRCLLLLSQSRSCQSVAIRTPLDLFFLCMVSSVLTNLVLLQMVTASVVIVQDIASNILLLHVLRRHIIWCVVLLQDAAMIMHKYDMQ